MAGKKYIIRSSGYIMGPYDKKEVKSLIESGTVSVNDEVVEPCSIGFYLQDHPDFIDFIQSLNMENRLTNFVLDLSGKFSSITKKTQPNLDKTQTITKPLDQEEDLSKVEDADFELIKEKTQEKRNTSQYQSVKESEQIAHKKIRYILRRSWQLIILLSLLVVGFVLFKEFIHPYQEKKSLLEKIRKEGIVFYDSGDYERSFKIFKEGSEKNILNVEEKKLFLNLLIHRRETGKAEILLREIESSLSQAHISLAKGLIAFFESSYASAEKFFLEVKGGSEEIGLLNFILLKWVKKDYQEVLDKANEMISKGYERGVIFYLKNFSLIKKNVKGDQIKQLIENSLKNSPEYYQELNLLLAYLYVEEGNLNKIEQLVKNILDWDSDFYKEYSYDSLIPIDTLDWSFLLPYCEKLFKLNTENYLLNALYGLCLLKVGSDTKGFQYIEKSKNQNPKDDLILSLFAYSLMKEGSFVEAEVFLNRIKESTYHLPFILKAKFFEQQKEWNLALKYWEVVLKMDSYHLSALGGKAFVNYKMKNYNDMKMYKDRGLNRYPHYVKILSLP